MTGADRNMLNDVVSGERPGRSFQHRSVSDATPDEQLRLSRIDSESLLDNPQINEYVLDELTSLDELSVAQRQARTQSLIVKVNNWESPTNSLTRLMVSARSSRYNRDVQRYSAEYRRSHPEAGDATVSSYAQRASNQKRQRVIELRRQRSSFKPNQANLQAGTMFARSAAVFGVANTGISYATATWDQVKDLEWASRLGYEMVMAYFMSL